MQCFDEQLLSRYMQGALSVADMIAAGEHICECAVCRTKLNATSSYRKALRLIEEASIGIGDCPEYEELSAFVDDTLPHETHQRILRHVNVCELCWHDMETLQAVRSRASLAPSITVRPGMFNTRRFWTVFGWRQLSAVSATTAAVILAFVLTNPNPTRVIPIATDKPGHKIVATNPVDKTPSASVADINSTKPAIGQNPKATPSDNQQPPDEEFVAELHDGSVIVGRLGDKVTARSSGREFEAQVAKLVDMKLRDGRVPSSFQIAKVEVRGPDDIVEIEKISPAPGGLSSSKPIFEWKPIEGSSKYRVEVYQLDGTPVYTAETEETSYKSDKTLPAGIYKWVVRARRGPFGEWDWSKAASFRILSAKETNLIAQVKRDYPGSHLVLGTVYESLGLNGDAVREFRALENVNPDSSLAKKLLSGALRKSNN